MGGNNGGRSGRRSGRRSETWFKKQAIERLANQAGTRIGRPGWATAMQTKGNKSENEQLAKNEGCLGIRKATKSKEAAIQRVMR